MPQHVQTSEKIRPWDTLECCWDVEQTSKTRDCNLIFASDHLSRGPDLSLFSWMLNARATYQVNLRSMSAYKCRCHHCEIQATWFRSQLHDFARHLTKSSYTDTGPIWRPSTPLKLPLGSNKSTTPVCSGPACGWYPGVNWGHQVAFYSSTPGSWLVLFSVSLLVSCMCDIVRFSSQYMSSPGPGPGPVSSHDNDFSAFLMTCG